MNRAEFCALPLPVALGYLWDHLDGVLPLHEASVPRRPLPPKYDMRLRVKGGRFMWASEATLSTLEWYRSRAERSAAEGGQYAESNAREAANLARWTTWRAWSPNDAWQGERDHSPVLAFPPSDKPKTHERTERKQEDTRPTRQGFDAPADTPDDLGDIPL